MMLRFDEHLRVSDRWAISGTHYARTLGTWLAQLDARRKAALAILRDAGYSAAGAQEALASWRMFLIAAEESWRHRAGNRWMVSHYLLERR